MTECYNDDEVTDDSEASDREELEAATRADLWMDEQREEVAW